VKLPGSRDDDASGRSPLRLGRAVWLYQGLNGRAEQRESVVRSHVAGLLACRPDDLEVRRDPFGKPHLVRPTARLKFSVSHRAGLVLVATAWDKAIGADVELLSAAADGSLFDVAGDFFAPDETARLAALPAETRGRAFLEAWTAKEAVLKAVGVGIAGGLKEPNLNDWLSSGRSLCGRRAVVPAAGKAYRVAWFAADTSDGPAIATCATGIPMSQKEGFLNPPLRSIT
jgi:4'-phosphopantetheinyl transferase